MSSALILVRRITTDPSFSNLPVVWRYVAYLSFAPGEDNNKNDDGSRNSRDRADPSLAASSRFAYTFLGQYAWQRGERRVTEVPRDEGEWVGILWWTWRGVRGNREVGRLHGVNRCGKAPDAAREGPQDQRRCVATRKTTLKYFPARSKRLRRVCALLKSSGAGTGTPRHATLGFARLSC